MAILFDNEATGNNDVQHRSPLQFPFNSGNAKFDAFLETLKRQNESRGVSFDEKQFAALYWAVHSRGAIV